MATTLVIDDEEPVSLMPRKLLERAGYAVTESVNGEEGIEAYRQRPTDLVVTDILMRKKGGLTLISELRRYSPNVRVLAISGGGREGKLNPLAAARIFPGVEMLSKPFARREFLAAVKDLLTRPAS